MWSPGHSLQVKYDLTIIIICPLRGLLLCFSIFKILFIKMYFMQRYFELLWSGIQIFLISEFLIGLTHFKLTKGKRRAKMFRCTLKVKSAYCVRLMPGSYVIKPYKRNKKICNYYVWKFQNHVTKITLEYVRKFR